MFRWMLVFLLLLAAPASLSAQRYYSSGGCYNGYCQPTYSYKQPTYSYSTPTYSAPSYPKYGDWDWKQWDRDPTYWVRFRYYWTTQYDRILENDGYLYLRDSGEWVRHCLIVDYKAKVALAPEYRGLTEAVYHAPTYAITQAYPYLNKPGMLIAQSPPGVIDPRSFLTPVESASLARQAFVEKSQSSVTDMALSVAKGEQEKELEQIRGRNRLAAEALASQNKERILASVERILAMTEQRATLTEEGTSEAASKIPVDDPQLAALIAKRCLSCHGTDKQSGKLDFRLADPDNAELWEECFVQVKSGLMPQEGEKLTPEEVGVFRSYMLRVNSRTQ